MTRTQTVVVIIIGSFLTESNLTEDISMKPYSSVFGFDIIILAHQVTIQLPTQLFSISFIIL